MTSSIKTSISNLEEYENSAVEYLDKEVDSDDLHELAQKYLRLKKGGKTDLFDSRMKSGSWGNSSNKKNVLLQLLINRHLIVDLKTLRNDDEFFTEYGVTSSQLLELAYRGFIVINIYAYESESKNGFEGYKQTPNIEKFLDRDLSNPRIIHLRREAFLRRIGKSKNGVNSDDNTGVLDTLLSKVKSTSSLSGARDQDNIPSALKAAASHYNVVKKILPFYDTPESKRIFEQSDYYLKSFENTLEKGDLDLNEEVTKLRGLKTLLAAPITSTMGGIYNMSESALNSVYKTVSYDVVQNMDSYRLMDSKVRDFLQLVNSYGHIEMPEGDPVPLSDYEFKQYLEFLIDMTDSINDLNETLYSIPNINSTEQRLKEGQSYLEIERKMRLTLSKTKSLERILECMSASFTFALSAFNLSIPEDVAISVGSEGVLWGYKEAMYNSTFFDKASVRIYQGLNQARTTMKRVK